jgi:hypothetical protein
MAIRWPIVPSPPAGSVNHSPRVPIPIWAASSFRDSSVSTTARATGPVL